jgi:hypothetical protein
VSIDLEGSELAAGTAGLPHVSDPSDPTPPIDDAGAAAEHPSRPAVDTEDVEAGDATASDDDLVEDDLVEVERAPLPGDSRASRLWRAIWRTHFYSALIAAPVLIMLALTGLVILYTEPIQAFTSRDLVTLDVGSGDLVSLDDQLDATTEEYPDLSFVAVTPPREADLATRFTMADENGSSY